MRKILVLRGGALGDCLVTFPALALLRRQWPAAAIHFVGHATAAALARSRGLVSIVHSQHEGRWRTLYADQPLPPELHAWLAEFDLVLNFWPDPADEIRRRFPLRPDQLFLSAPALPTRAPAAAHYCAPLAALGLHLVHPLFPLAPVAPVSTPAPGAIVVHPGSGSPRKNWPHSRWLALLQELPRPLTLLLGEAEVDRWSRVSLPQVSVLTQAPLETLVTHLSRSRLFLGHDSGLSHLAAACGTPCLLLFGPTDAATWAPPGPQVEVIQRGEALESITLADVREAVATALRRSPPPAGSA